MATTAVTGGARGQEARERARAGIDGGAIAGVIGGERRHYRLEQGFGAAAAIIHPTLTPITECYIKGMTEALTMWNTLRERLSPNNNVGHRQSLHTEFDLLPLTDKEHINTTSRSPTSINITLRELRSPLLTAPS